MTKIQWTEKVWNPVTGCTKIAVGCKNCYAEKMTRRFWKQWGCEAPPNHFKVQQHPERLDIPLRWKKPCRVFVNSMSDLFHEKVDIAFLTHTFDIIHACPQHAFQILTKRPKNALRMMWGKHGNGWRYFDAGDYHENIWFGVSCSTQADIDRMVPALLQIPAAVRFVSLEPLLEPIVMEWWLTPGRLDWVIVGCESGPGARPCKDKWVQEIVRQCREANVRVFVKQLTRNGRAWKLTDQNRNEWPSWAVQEYPQ